MEFPAKPGTGPFFKKKKKKKKSNATMARALYGQNG